MKKVSSFWMPRLLVSHTGGDFVELSESAGIMSASGLTLAEDAFVEPPTDPSFEPVTISCEVGGCDFRRLCRASRLPRKQKKAIGQMWNMGIVGDEMEVSFEPKRRTRWQRMMLRRVKCEDGVLYIPMKNGFTFMAEPTTDML